VATFVLDQVAVVCVLHATFRQKRSFHPLKDWPLPNASYLSDPSEESSKKADNPNDAHGAGK
jgi:hypothetical protein